MAVVLHNMMAKYLCILNRQRRKRAALGSQMVVVASYFAFAFERRSSSTPSLAHEQARCFLHRLSRLPTRPTFNRPIDELMLIPQYCVLMTL